MAYESSNRMISLPKVAGYKRTLRPDYNWPERNRPIYTATRVGASMFPLPQENNFATQAAAMWQPAAVNTTMLPGFYSARRVGSRSVSPIARRMGAVASVRSQGLGYYDLGAIREDLVPMVVDEDNFGATAPWGGQSPTPAPAPTSPEIIIRPQMEPPPPVVVEPAAPAPVYTTDGRIAAPDAGVFQVFNQGSYPSTAKCPAPYLISENGVFTTAFQKYIECRSAERLAEESQRLQTEQESKWVTGSNVYATTTDAGIAAARARIAARQVPTMTATPQGTVVQQPPILNQQGMFGSLRTMAIVGAVGVGAYFLYKAFKKGK